MNAFKPDGCQESGKEQGDYRYTLEQSGKQMLFVIGLNPSTAHCEHLDNTMRRVIGFAGEKNYDGFVMLNLSAERQTNRWNMASELNEEHHQKNLECMKTLSEKYPDADILFAYGNGIETRRYLKERCLPDILNVFNDHKGRRLKIGELTKRRNPRHPLFAKSEWKFSDVDVKTL